MGMYEAIKNFHAQFAFRPEIVNGEKLRRFDKFVVCGMGGSHLAADLVRVWNPEADIIVHSDYGLPAVHNKERLVIASSYSGNTEETIDAFLAAREKNLPVAAIATGGKLLVLAREAGVPYVELPDTGIQPRMATGFGFMALLKIMGEENALKEASQLSQILLPADIEADGRALAKKLEGHVPLIYASRRNGAIAQNWKIKFNETGKIPAFYNILPELNHNEMTGFDIADSTRALSKNFAVLLLRDQDDYPRVSRRADVLERLYRERGLKVENVALGGRNISHKIFSSLILADWTAYYTAQLYGVEANEVPMVEEFKGLIQNL